MTIEELRAWIIDRYGPITEAHGNGVHVAIAPIYQSLAVGLGSNPSNAIYDLRLDLSINGRAEEIPGLAFLPWEKRRQAERQAMWERERRTQPGANHE